MQLFTTAGLLAMLALSSVVSTLPSPTDTTVAGVLDSSVTFDEYIKHFKAPETTGNTSLTARSDSEALEKRWASANCGGIFLSVFVVMRIAVDMGEAAIRSLQNPTDTDLRRFDRYFGYWQNNPTARSIIATRYRYIVNTLWATNFNLICLPNVSNGNVLADVSSAGAGQGDNVRLYASFFNLPDYNACGEVYTKPVVMVHEASHVFGAVDHGNDQGNDAYLLMWYAQSAYGNCGF